MVLEFRHLRVNHNFEISSTSYPSRLSGYCRREALILDFLPHSSMLPGAQQWHVIYTAINRAELPCGVVELCKRPRLEARIDWLAFEGQHTEDAFMYPAEWLLTDKRARASIPRANSRSAREGLVDTERLRSRANGGPLYVALVFVEWQLREQCIYVALRRGDESAGDRPHSAGD